MKNESVIRTEGLSRDFGSVRAVDELTLAVEQGRIIALLGPNGAGKTTFMNLVTGRLEPTAGKAWVFERQSRKLSKDVCARIADMGDRSEPNRWATLKQLRDLQADAAIEFDLRLFEQFCKKRNLSLRSTYGTLSKGQRRWVLASLVLASKAELLLLDEPADGLDPSARRELYDHIRDYVTQGNATAVVATHVIGDIERVADEVAIIDRGRLILHASLEDLREELKEIELPGDSAVPEMGPDVELLASKVEAGTRIVWIRCRNMANQALAGQLGGHTVIRNVSLETLYLVMTETRNQVIEPS